MEWVEYKVLTEGEFGDAVAELFHRMDSGGVVLEEEPQPGPAGEPRLWVKAYFPADADRREELALSLQALERHSGASCRLFSRYMKNEDWEHTWKEFFHCFRVGERIIIRPSWEEYAAGAGDVVVCIDPDMAFGTGQHTTTRFCLELLERHLIPGSRVLDAGCGSGILAIAAAGLGAGMVFGIDNDELAVRIARENVALNGAEGQIGIMAGELSALEEHTDLGFDLIVANLTDWLLTELAEVLYVTLAVGGRLIVSGINHTRWAPLREKLLGLGFAPAEEVAQGEWIGAVLLKP